MRSATGVPTYGGSCFLFRQGNVALTAAHCLDGRGDRDLYMGWPLWSRTGDLLGTPVVDVVRHPVADLAILRLPQGAAEAWDPPRVPFKDAVPVEGFAGPPFNAIGFPLEVLEETGGHAPTPRVFVGYWQRRFLRSGAGDEYTYEAGEMSIPAPVGLSGGPVFGSWSAEGLVMGVVTAQHSSYTIESAYEEVQADGKHYRHERASIVQYGVALLLEPLRDWLDEHVPLLE
jgi:hypothetical protein